MDGKIEKFINLNCLHKKNIHDESRPKSSHLTLIETFSKNSQAVTSTHFYIIAHPLNSTLMSNTFTSSSSPAQQPQTIYDEQELRMWILNLKNKRWRVDWSMDKKGKARRKNKIIVQFSSHRFYEASKSIKDTRESACYWKNDILFYWCCNYVPKRLNMHNHYIKLPQ